MKLGRLIWILALPFFVACNSPQLPLDSSIFRTLAKDRPSLWRWISPLDLPDDVPPGERHDLAWAVIPNEVTGEYRLAFAFTQAYGAFSYHLLASNLPVGTPLELILVGKKGTLIGQLRYEKAIPIVVKGILTETAISGVPVGQYICYVALPQDKSSVQPPPLSPLKPAPEASSRIRDAHSVFLGGKEDDQYRAELKAFHTQLQAQEKEELPRLSKWAEAAIVFVKSLAASQVPAPSGDFPLPSLAEPDRWVRANEATAARDLQKRIQALASGPASRSESQKLMPELMKFRSLLLALQKNQSH